MSEGFVQIWGLLGVILLLVGVAVIKARKAGPFLLLMLVILGYAAITVAVATGGQP